MTVGAVCDNFTCDRGYERNPAIGLLTCTDSGQWNYNLSTLCVGLYQLVVLLLLMLLLLLLLLFIYKKRINSVISPNILTVQILVN